jgi:hypothetical protein
VAVVAKPPPRQLNISNAIGTVAIDKTVVANTSREANLALPP